MLDQMSGGRLELGVGRGVSPHEVAYYGVDPARAQAMYVESLRIILAALAGRSVSYAGEFYAFCEVPFELQPVQRPHPPLWYGLSRPEARYRADWAAAGHAEGDLPLMGMTRTVVVAATTAEALATARRAHKCWHRSFMELWNKHGTRPINASYPDEFDEAQRLGFGIAGTPATVRDELQRQITQARVNYLVCRFAFGDMALAEALGSVELFARHVMPELATPL